MLWHRSVSLSRLVTTTFVLSSSSSTNVFCRGLHICILCGSTRTNGPPRPILSDRVAKYIETCFLEPTTTITIGDNNKRDDEQTVKHDVSMIRVRDDFSRGLMERPHFTYPKSQVPKELEDVGEILKQADAYVVITPEYNHAPCPGLMNMLNHFGSSVFAFKPSGIVSYSAGQWGGTRAAHSLRPFLSELGCLPVSAMVHIPYAQQQFNDQGRPLKSGEEEGEEERWSSYVHRMIHQLEWWAHAAKQQRSIQDPFTKSPAFTQHPSQRNAPS